jgi:hypothetical protein
MGRKGGEPAAHGIGGDVGFVCLIGVLCSLLCGEVVNVLVWNRLPLL